MLHSSELQCLTEWTGGPAGVPAAGAEHSTAPGSAEGPVLLAQILHPPHPPPPQIRTASGLTQRFSKLLPGLCHLSATYEAKTPVLGAKASSGRGAGGGGGGGGGRGRGDASATVLKSNRQNLFKGIASKFSKREFYFRCATEIRYLEIYSWRFDILQRRGPERGRACL